MESNLENIFKESNLVGVDLLVVKNDKVVESIEYGQRSIENNESMTLDTVFRIASISKTVLALGIMKLVEEGVLDINSDISDYLGFKLHNPNYPSVKITLKMVMTQTSSITDGYEDNYETDFGYNGVNGKYFPVTLEELLIPGGKYYIDETFDKDYPGTNFIYSNFNCGILACIIERVTKRFYVDFMREEIFIPLGIDASFDIADIKSRNIASLYNDNNGKIELLRDYNIFMKKRYMNYDLGNNFRGPAGGLFISPNDLKVIMDVLLNGGKPILKEKTIQLMLSTHWQGQQADGGYYKAKGLQVVILDHYNNKTLKGHFGDAYGVRSFMLFNEEKQLGMIYMTNGGGYKRTLLGIDNVQNDVIKLVLDKYWE